MWPCNWDRPEQETAKRDSVLHDFDRTQRRKGRKGRISFAFLASLRANRELLNLASSGKALFSAASATTISAPLVRLQSASLQVLLPLWGVALGWFSRAGVQAEAWPLVLYAPCASCGIIASSAAQHLDNRIASWMYPRFCRGRHLSLRPCGPRPVLACRVLPDLAVPAATRPNCCAGATAWPTRLAPGCTLAQPATSLPPLVGSYPTVSALTGPL